MYVRTSARRNKSGELVRYVQLAHNEWDPAAGMSRTRVLHSFGREDEVDRAAVARLVAALSRLLDPAEAAAAAGPAQLTLTGSRPMGGAYVLDTLWRRLGIDTAIGQELAGSRVDATRVERILFALTANRALHPSSKLAATDWISHDVHIDGLTGASHDACYRAMDALLGVEAALTRRIYDQVADLLNLEVDLLFFDTTSTYFQTGEPDPPTARDTHGRARPDATPTDPVRDSGFRSHGHSKDHRGDLPQIVIGMAVTRDGIPVRVWSWPGNYSDSTLIRQVKDDMRDWSLARIVWVADRGFSSADNRRYLQSGGGHYIIGEKLRTGSAEVNAALSWPGRYATITANMRVKEINLDEGGDRLVLCHNPETAQRDKHVRDELITHLAELIADSDTLDPTERAELHGRIRTKPGLARYLHTTHTGLLRIDHTTVTAEARLDGKYLLRCSDPTLSTADIAIGYKQLLEVERGWRDMKTILDLRPVHHRREERIRAHVLLCWLALLLIRIIETSTGRTWPKTRAELDRLHIVTFTGNAGTYRRTTELTKPQRDLLTALNITPPHKIVELTSTP